MAKHRSKQSRLRTQERRRLQLKSSTVQDNESFSAQRTVLENVFSYDAKLIMRDLRKTILLVIFILLVLLSIALIYT
jgi:hypothetical protein